MDSIGLLLNGILLLLVIVNFVIAQRTRNHAYKLEKNARELNRRLNNAQDVFSKLSFSIALLKEFLARHRTQTDDSIEYNSEHVDLGITDITQNQRGMVIIGTCGVLNYELEVSSGRCTVRQFLSDGTIYEHTAFCIFEEVARNRCLRMIRSNEMTPQGE